MIPLDNFQAFYRQQEIEKREQIPDRPKKNQQIAARLLPFFQEGMSVGYYLPIRSEANAHIEELVASCHFKDPLKLVVPKVLNKTEMAFYPAKNLVPGFQGILEPKLEEGQKEVIPDILIIPILCFWNGYRMGYGGGYYDRYLAKHPNCLRIGIAYDEQEDSFRPGPWDERLDFIVTPTRTLIYPRDEDK